jgi:hypothetical protein
MIGRTGKRFGTISFTMVKSNEVSIRASFGCEVTVIADFRTNNLTIAAHAIARA